MVKYLSNWNKEHSKAIYCYETNKIYYSLRETCRELNLKSRKNIKLCCEGKTSIVNGYHFCYENDIEKLKNRLNVSGKIYCYETELTFDNIEDVFNSNKYFSRTSTFEDFKYNLLNSIFIGRPYKEYHWCYEEHKEDFIKKCQKEEILRDKDFYGIIYKITCLVNNKIYIGQTEQKMNERFSQHFYDAQRANHYNKFYNAIKKYGRDNFIIEKIDEAYTLKELNEKEQYWIGYYNSDSRNGYNTCSGGKAHFTYTEELKKRLAKASGKEVYCFETKKVYESLTEAERLLHLQRKAIGKCCQGKQNNTKGYHFCYIEDKETYKPCMTSSEKKYLTGRKIYCKELNMYFENCRIVYDYFLNLGKIKNKFYNFQAGVSFSIRTKRERFGYHWESIE